MRPEVEVAKLPDAEMTFVDPMLCEPVSTLPAGDTWLYEIKLDGYRALVLISKAGVKLLSRRNNALNTQFPSLIQALAKLPENTILDGEIVALDEDGRPSFNLLQHHQSRAAAIVYYAFDLLAYQGKRLLGVPLHQRQMLLRWVLRGVGNAIRRSEPLTVTPERLIAAARTHGLEGLIAKRRDSLYEPGQRSGAWAKYKVNRGQELVIGGYLPGAASFEALLVGYYENERLLFLAKIRNGFVPHVKREIAQRFRALETTVCPFANLPEPKTARRGLALTAEAMKQCRWLRPELVTQIEFTEWTKNDHLRHARFVGLRDDKPAREVRRDSV